MSETAESPAAVLPAPARSWKRDVLFGIVVFLCGMVVGGGAVVRWHATHPPRLSAMTVDKARAFARMKRVLNLDEEQARKVQAIVMEGLGDLKDVRRAVRPKVDVIIERIRGKVEKELNEKQKEKWNKEFNAIRDRWLPPAPDTDNTAVPQKP